MMYAKVFEKILDSSIAEDYLLRHIFEDLLKLADKDGFVDRTIPAISRRLNIPEKLIESKIRILESPDLKSRTDDDDGMRLRRIDGHRDWGWEIINYKKYRCIHNSEEARESSRKRSKAYRESKKDVINQHKSKNVTRDESVTARDAKSRHAKSRQVEVEAEVEAEVYINTVNVLELSRSEKASCPPTASHSVPIDPDFFKSLKQNIAYKHIDFEREFGKMAAWHSLPKNKNRIFTKQFFLNWFNRIDPNETLPSYEPAGFQSIRDYAKEVDYAGKDVHGRNGEVNGELPESQSAEDKFEDLERSSR